MSVYSKMALVLNGLLARQKSDDKANDQIDQLGPTDSENPK